MGGRLPFAPCLSSENESSDVSYTLDQSGPFDLFLLSCALPMSSETIALRCPACGSAKTVDSRVVHFGYEFTCEHCKTISVLVIHSKLHIRAAGEYVCGNCGRIARDGDRFCECSKPLTRPCLMCAVAFFAGRNVCPRCGWNHEQDPNSPQLQVSIAKEFCKLVKDGRFNEAAQEAVQLGKLVVSSQLLTPEAMIVFKKGLVNRTSEHGRLLGGVGHIIRANDHATLKLVNPLVVWFSEIEGLERIAYAGDPFQGIEERLNSVEGRVPSIFHSPGTIGGWSGFIALLIGWSAGDGIWDKITKGFGSCVVVGVIGCIISAICGLTMQSASASEQRDAIRAAADEMKRKQAEARKRLDAEIEAVKRLEV